MECGAVLGNVDSMVKHTVMVQIVQIVQNVWAMRIRAAELVFKIGAVTAIEVLVFVSKVHGVTPSCKMGYLY